MRKVLVIGLDGASLNPIKSWAEKGELPTFKKLLENGASGKLRSTMPPLTAPAWASFMTGMNPGKHGIFRFRRKDDVIVNWSDMDGKTLWRILSDEHKRVIVVGVPMTFPPEKVNGILVSGFLAPPDDIYTYPPEFRKTLKTRFPRYRVYMRKTDPRGLGVKAAGDWLADLHSLTREQADVVIHLLCDSTWDFFMTVFSGTDWIAHVFWRYTDPKCPGYDVKIATKYRNAFLTYYKQIDSILKRILELAGKNVTIFIMSDHGTGPYYHVFDLSEWLIKLGLLEKKKLGPHKIGYWLKKTKLDIRDLIVLLSRHSNLLRLTRFLLNRIPIGSSITSSPDWSRTLAYADWGGIRVNLKGREPEGVVEPGESYEKLRNFMMQNLSELRYPESGERIFDVILKKEDIYSGPYLHRAPDLLFWPKGPHLISKGLTIPRQVLRSSLNWLPETLQSAKHEIDGLFIAFGENIKKNERVEKMKILDIAPTILYTMGVPIPPDMDGVPLKGIFEQPLDLARRRQRRRGLEIQEKEKYRPSPEEEEKIKEILKALGYLE